MCCVADVNWHDNYPWLEFTDFSDMGSIPCWFQSITIYINPIQKEWSLPILAVSFGMFIVFSRMTFSSRFINRCARSAFAVYLITEQHYFRDEMLWHWVALSNFYRSRYSLLIALISVVVVVIIATVLDFMRQFLFWCTVDRQKGRLFEYIWCRARNIIRCLFRWDV